MTNRVFERLDRNKIHHTGGFTMLEMMIVVVIIGLVAAMAAPTFFSATPRLRARIEARNLLNMVRLARSRAISEGNQYGVYIDINSRQYLVFKDTVNPPQMTYEIGDSIAVGPETIQADVVISGSTFTNDCVVFKPTGGASQSGGITFDIDGGGASYTVSVLASTGKSKLQ